MLEMETEDVISLPASSSPANGGDNEELNDSGCQPSEQNCQSLDVLEVNVNESHGSSTDIVNEDNQLLLDADNKSENQDKLEVIADAGLMEDGNGLCNHAEDAFQDSCPQTRANSLSGAFKRPRLAEDEQQPSVQVIYKSLTRDSKRKLEELLQQWSQWHAQNCSSANDSGSGMVSGEETYFPALQVGADKPSAMSFWMENETSGQNKELIRFDGNSVPLYDRGYSSGLTSADDSSSLERVRERAEDSRCFNCGSYSHSLKDCPKPRDNVAVNNARKQHKVRRNQNAAARNPTRYYQNTPGGKYDGLKPGTLEAETRKLLGLGELDPPPWLNRMREIGYPPGYLEVDDQPSGITIFGSGESREETEEGEILESSHNKAPKKKSVEFPGVNAPIPENADEERWAASGSSDLYMSRNHSYSRYNRPSEPISRGRHHEQQRWSRDVEDDEPPPPGCEPESSFSSIYSRRYGGNGYDSGYNSHSPRDSPTVPWSSSFGRSLSDRSRRSPLRYDDSPRYHPYGSFPYSSTR
ncbi:hypothetical protein M9H77_15674 [Catharanthus roseus]|uniref:Uncharacterized protein n=1 Tax=Catharanthus roseus TaxID=4058 RepID=A0ACC0B110_CATRO|nr:hypothetical protein M9H77_15674 [Catharanthus roseus]